MSEVNAPEGYTNEPAGNNPTAIIALAQKLHDEFVADGKAQAAEMIDSAKTEHDRLLAEASQAHSIAFNEAQREATGLLERANETATQAVSEAQLKAKIIVAEAEDRASSLTETILKLQAFEASYRANLKALAETALESLGFGVVPEDEISLPDTVDYEAETEALPIVEHDVVEHNGVNYEDLESASDADAEDAPEDEDKSVDDSEVADSDESNDTAAESEDEQNPEHKE